MGGVTQQEYSLTVKAIAPKITTKKLPDAEQGNDGDNTALTEEYVVRRIYH